jgi:hypothetical protein
VDAKVAYAEGLAESVSRTRAADAVEDLIGIEHSTPPPALRAQAARFQSLRAARGEHATAEQGFMTAEAIFREHGLSPARCHAPEHGEWPVAQGRSEDAEAPARGA